MAERHLLDATQFVGEQSDTLTAKVERFDAHGREAEGNGTSLYLHTASS